MIPAAELYGRIYAEDPAYGMRRWRQEALATYLSGLEPRPDSMLDVGCGRGESLGIARRLGIREVQGAEIVPALCSADVTLLERGAVDLPFATASFALVAALDVLEHLEERDVVPALCELWRVARQRVLLGMPHKQDHGGLHLTVEDRRWWTERMAEATGLAGSVSVVNLPIPEAKQPHSFFDLRKP